MRQYSSNGKVFPFGKIGDGNTLIYCLIQINPSDSIIEINFKIIGDL